MKHSVQSYTLGIIVYSLKHPIKDFFKGAAFCAIQWNYFPSMQLKLLIPNLIQGSHLIKIKNRDFSQS